MDHELLLADGHGFHLYMLARVENAEIVSLREIPPVELDLVRPGFSFAICNPRHGSGTAVENVDRHMRPVCHAEFYPGPVAEWIRKVLPKVERRWNQIDHDAGNVRIRGGALLPVLSK